MQRNTGNIGPIPKKNKTDTCMDLHLIKLLHGAELQPVFKYCAKF